MAGLQGLTPKGDPLQRMDGVHRLKEELVVAKNALEMQGEEMEKGLCSFHSFSHPL